ncbi:metallothionein-like protein type 3 [Fagus crenata]
MSDKCGNCDCADKSQCVKKGSSYGLVIVETDKSYTNTVVMDAPAAEHDGKCKCGASCSCTNCTCGH